MREPFGFVNAFKPPGPTSTALGAWVRKLLGASALGHWGTLDPAACGVLVLAVGNATRLLPYLPADDKTYVFELRVGATTDTGDAGGRTLASAPVSDRWADGLERIAASMIGPLAQVPPLYSAVKVGGRPLYELARKGLDAPREPRTVRIDRLEVLGIRGSVARMRVRCSAGTYVRTLCEQIGERLELPAHMGFLLRTHAGPFALSGARTPAEIAADPAACLTDPLDVLALPRIAIESTAIARFMHGNPVEMPHALPQIANGSTVLVLDAGALLGVARVDGATIAPLRVLAGRGENR